MTVIVWFVYGNINFSIINRHAKVIRESGRHRGQYTLTEIM